jgi:O-antigen ligase
VYAIRDLAIFGYSIFFPLTYLAIRHRQDAAKIIKYSTYSGVILAAALVIQATTGLQLGLGIAQREVMGQTVSDVGGGDVGGVIAFSGAALLAYIAYNREHRALHTGLLFVCLLALAANTTRAALVGLLLAAALIFVLGELRHKTIIGLAVALLALAAAAGAAGALPRFMQAVYIAGLSGMSGPAVDPTAAFRMVRWNYAWQLWLSHPLFGLGFGRLLLPYSLDSQNFGAGFFNGGMPHNTFLFLLARMGLVGFGLIAYCWVVAIILLGRRVIRRPDADQMAAASILIAMMGFAFFVLFFERPGNSSAFWIILAASLRLLSADSRQLAIFGPRLQNA